MPTADQIGYASGTCGARFVIRFTGDETRRQFWIFPPASIEQLLRKSGLHPRERKKMHPTVLFQVFCNCLSLSLQVGLVAIPSSSYFRRGGRARASINDKKKTITLLWSMYHTLEVSREASAGKTRRGWARQAWVKKLKLHSRPAGSTAPAVVFAATAASTKKAAAATTEAAALCSSFSLYDSNNNSNTSS